MKFISDNNITNKRIILRCDFNVPVKDNKIIDTSKIDKSLKTIDYLLKNNNIVILMSHFGRVKTDADKEHNSLKIVYNYLKDIYNLEFIDNPLNLDLINNSNKKLFLVENTRYTDIPNKMESANSLDLAAYWAKFADVFVMDAFASLHRAHSSTAGLSRYLDTYFGLLVEEEIKKLNPLIDIKNHPFLVIMGGAKVDDKITIIENILKRCDKLLLTGGILNTFLKVMGYNTGDSLVSNDEDILNKVKDILDEHCDKILWCNKFIVKRDNQNIEIKIEDIANCDIIYDNIINPLEDITSSRLVFFNGTCGMYEDSNYKKGTQELLDILAKCPGKVFIGGGDTASAVKKLSDESLYTYISSGGGATLSYIATSTLDAIDYILNK